MNLLSHGEPGTARDVLRLGDTLNSDLWRTQNEFLVGKDRVADVTIERLLHRFLAHKKRNN